MPFSFAENKHFVTAQFFCIDQNNFDQTLWSRVKRAAYPNE